MTPDQWIALAASVGACLSALATFLTVRQIARQREASFRPELAMSQVHFEAGPDPIRAGLLPTKWIARNWKGKEMPATFEELSLPLRNIGLGSARGVHLHWDFDLAGTVKSANELAQRTLTPAYFSIDDWGVSIKSEALGNGSSLWKNQREVVIDFVLPASIDKEPVLVRLPDAYVQLAAALIYLRSRDKGREHSFELPSLNAAFKFSDIGGIKHEAVFDVKVHLLALAGSGEGMTGYVECSKRV
ncbi:hypothetical protein [Alcaligenes faecalis]|uniref:Uncharacterized protein n=1 Tax=Alcaligenes faecalis TaxID=511 RepID=A0A2U2BLQ1_ALCFA|nr:hypothetical protein [Alcaligenes faecalis]PWE14916.1 hypothetical protein DF183_09520 [Alcaligenes faecalis]